MGFLLKEIRPYVNVKDIISPVVNIDNIYAWTDSITYSHIMTYPYRWNTFVANQVSQILEYTAPSIWRYVQSEKILADCVSRGIFSFEIISHQLWWREPTFLLQNPCTCPETSLFPELSLHQISTMKKHSNTTLQLTPTKLDHVLNVILRHTTKENQQSQFKEILYFYQPRNHVPFNCEN